MFDLLNGRITVFTGFGKGSGKTTLFGAAVNEAQRAGPVGIFTIGFDGASGKSPIIQVKPKDILITTVPLARAADASLDIIEALPGRSAIGRLCLARSVRAGSAALVGPEHFGQLASVIDLIRQKNLVNSILIDGAVGRVTHVSALPDSQFLYCAQADAANFRRVAENIELISALSNLPLDADGYRTDITDGKLHIEGPLTAPMLETIPKEITQISIETFSDCFLDAATFKRASRHLTISLRRHIPLLGFVIALRNVKREIFLDTVPSASSRIIFNPFEIEAA
ncbi:MAG: hypothetical protein LBH03_00430 [Holophagales bacterium]|jgi:hypothetical protein|nr:hypothetical protein [Holophagales bacterium]